MPDHNDPIAQLKAEYQQTLRLIFHDINAPLRHMRFFVEEVLERETALSEKSTADLNHILSSVAKAKSLLNDISAYARIDSHTLELQPHNSKELIEHALWKLQNQSEAPKVTCSIEELPELVGDRELLQELFFALLDNAFKFHDAKGNAQVWVKGREDGDHVHIAICDNGIGMEEKHLEPALLLLRRMAGAEYPGNGSGLAIAKRIVDRHGGKISLKSAGKGQGLTVNVWLPRL